MVQTKEIGSLGEAAKKEEGRGSSLLGFIFLPSSHTALT